MKNKKALYLLFAANGISGIAQGISMLAIPWYFTSIINDSETFGLIYAITTIVTLFWGLYAGTLIDRYSRKLVFLSICVVSFILLLGVSLVGFYLGEVPIYLIALVFCFTIFNYNIHYPTLYAFGQEITEKENYGKTNSLIEIIGQLTSIVSGVFAAILLTGVNKDFLNQVGLGFLKFNVNPWQLHEIFLLDALTYVAAFVLILFIKYTPIATHEIDKSSVWNRLIQGFSYLKKHPLLFHFGVSSFAIFVILLIHVHQLMPIYVSKHLHSDSSAYAIGEVVYAFGALIAGAGIRWIFRKTNTIYAIIVLMIISVVRFEILTFSNNILIFMMVSFVLGITNAGARILRITYLFNHIPNHIIGRTGSVFNTVNIFLRFVFIGIFSLPFFHISNHIIWAYFIGGMFILVSIIPLLLYYKKLVHFNISDE
ncbi:MAG: MFS transporter [Flavobacteriales bacterium]|nr:MFS transporter [Flavobacteriales bacterium]